jgi:3-oxoacyl-[acyl-carrier-protein] synthase II
MTMERRPDVVVTGLGLTTPLGAGTAESWGRLLDGASAVTPEGARVPLSSDDDPRTLQLARRAAREALADAGFPDRDLGESWACAVSGTKPLISTEERVLQFLSPDAVAHAVARSVGVQGPVTNLSAACATGLVSVMTAAQWIRDGRCDRALAGSAESSFHPLYWAGFAQMGVFSKSGVVRPFDRRRDGFLPGEGAGVFVLERADAARARGARIHGVLRGWDFACDAHDAVRFNGEGRVMGRSLARSLERAGWTPSDLDYVNAHGTATRLNDRLESLALESLFAGHRAPPVSSTKGATGHLLGATGAVEFGFTLLSLRDGALPPTLNLDEPETECLDFVPCRARSAPVRRAAALSFGFGGAIASVVVGRSS